MSVSWAADARCLTVGPAVMIPEGTGGHVLIQQQQAKDVCAHCRVRPECLELALALEGDHGPAWRAGVWGGLNEAERAHLARQRRGAAA